jgi:hypothetical protein
MSLLKFHFIFHKLGVSEEQISILIIIRGWSGDLHDLVINFFGFSIKKICFASGVGLFVHVFFSDSFLASVPVHRFCCLNFSS